MCKYCDEIDIYEDLDSMDIDGTNGRIVLSYVRSPKAAHDSKASITASYVADGTSWTIGVPIEFCPFCGKEF